MQLTDQERAMLDGSDGQGAAEGDGTARALRRGARRRALRRHDQRRGRTGLVQPVPAELLPQARRRLRRDLLASSTSTATSWSKCRRRSRRPATCRAARPGQLAGAGRHARGLPHRQRERSRSSQNHGIQHPEDLHALPRRQRAAARRALRLDGILRGRLLQFRASARAPTRKAARAPAPRCSPARSRTGAFIATKTATARI